jgi:hypothetical protein
MMNEFKPVAWLLMNGTIISEYSYNIRKLKEDGDIPLFTKVSWVDMTNQELVDLRERVQEYTPMDSIKYGEAIQRAMAQALKEKNT